ncbi:hypothetical protein H312_01098 [Anncaliia algerae PRA339]|uniref:RRM domain-containing protein n=1 Tax=Anncaliia algerae PRA339 TaxID=1288291 RepID=A0A059F2V6_9MICR|nr:hypothetical protein H312_01098 [Anncaliia algerae PRA339]
MEIFEENKDISNVRVIQRNLVYVIGIPHKYASEEILKSKNFFGQFGEIKKIVINRRLVNNVETTISAYITFKYIKEAENAIAEVDETVLDNRIIKCTYGTTKYCAFFLKNSVCQNNECMYLHSTGRDEDTITKDEMYVIRHKLHSFEAKNKNKEVLGKERENLTFKLLFKYKPERIIYQNDKITFKPIDYI